MSPEHLHDHRTLSINTMSSEGAFLNVLFGELEKAGILYAVMRNYASLPESVAGSDLDILIGPEDETAVREIVFRSIDCANGAAIGCSSTFGFFKVFSFGCNRQEDNSWWGVRIDVNVGYSFKGTEAINLRNSFKYQRTYNGVNVLEPGFGAVLGILKEVLNNNYIPERYQVEAARVVQADWQRLCSALAPLGEKGLVLLRQMILAESGEADVLKQAKSLRRALAIHAFSRSPVVFIRNRFLHECAKVKRYLRPSGVIVAVLGVDGVGKSTVINAIKPVLEDATHGALEIKHLRPGLLPPLARLKGKQSVLSEPVLDPHGSAPSGVIGSVFRLAYLTADYVLGYWLLLRPKIARSPTVILFDRYCFDMVLDPRRFRLGIGRRFIEWFMRLIPKPDVVLCLHAEPEAITARKQELPIDEITRQINALRELAKREPRAILVSTEGSVDEVRDRVLTALMDYFKRRGDDG